MIEEKEIFINGLKINYKIAGQGPAILILHGWSGSSDSWISVQEILAKAGFKVICPDLPGCGKSPPPTEPWGMDEYINLISNFTKQVSLEQFSLIGHSFGGGLAVKFAAFFPEKIKKLILLDAAVVRTERLSLRQKFARFLAKMSYAFTRIPFFEKTIFSMIRPLVYKIAGVRDYYQSKGVMRETFKKIFKEDLSQYLPKVKTPTLIVWGKRDSTLPVEDGFLMQKEIFNSQIEIIEEADHSPHRKTPEKLAEIILHFLRP